MQNSYKKNSNSEKRQFLSFSPIVNPYEECVFIQLRSTHSSQSKHKSLIFSTALSTT